MRKGHLPIALDELAQLEQAGLTDNETIEHLDLLVSDWAGQPFESALLDMIGR